MKKLISLLCITLLTWTYAAADDLTINSADDWQTFVGNADTYASGTITLAADISVSAPYAGTFSGTFDGQGHTITLSLPSNGKQAPFTTASGATFKNLTIDGTLSSDDAVAGLVMNATGAVTLSGVNVKATITSTKYPVAGYIAYATARVTATDCSFTGSLDSKANASADVAGFISQVSGGGSFSFNKCVAGGSIKLTGWRAAGFASTVTSTQEADCEFLNCVVSADIYQENGSERLGGFVGSPNSDKLSYTMKGCLITGKVKRLNSNTDRVYISTTNGLVMGCNDWRTFKSATVEDCYYTSSTEFTDYKSAPFNFTFAPDEDLTSGRLCYNLNGDQTATVFRQQLGDGGDAMPSLDQSKPIVYANGRRHCDGTDYDNFTYSNTASAMEQDEHTYVDNVCSYCGALKIDDDGYFHVVNTKGWEAFVSKHNAGEKAINVKLETDISVSESLADGYMGTFDGQGHTVNLTLGQDDGMGKYAMFGYANASTYRNIVFTGNITGESNCASIAVHTSGKVLIENVVSTVNIKQTTLNDGNCAGFVGVALANLTIRNSIFAGKVEAKKDAGGFVGWADGKTFTLENCAMVGDVTIEQGVSAIFLRVKTSTNTVSMTNCYYTPCTPEVQNGSGSDIVKLGKEISTDLVTNGELCYKLNGDQTTISLYQTIGTDTLPVPGNGKSLRVYANGHKHCDGTDYEGLTYTNTETETQQDAHDFDEDHVCTYCGNIETDENGVFHITRGKGLAAFARAVNKGQDDLCAVLDGDVTLEGIGTSDETPMIGIGGIKYRGTFDGQGHNIYVTVDGGGQVGGLFEYVNGATLRNFTIEGSVSNATQAGLVGQADVNAPTFEKIINKLNVSGTWNVAGFLGCSNATTKHVFRNCLFAGKASYVGDANKNGMGGFVGWSKTGTYELTSCATVGEIDLGGGTTAAMLARVNASVAATNCAYVPAEGVKYANGSGSERNGSPVKVADATTGEICYILNGKSFKDPVWYQTIGTDEYPTFDSTHEVVYKSIDGYASSLVDDGSVSSLEAGLMEEAESFISPENNLVQKSIADAYMEKVNALSSYETYSDLCAAYYPAIDSLRKAAEASAAAYAAYNKKVDETKAYMEEHASDFKGGPIYDMLSAYLGDDEVDPSADQFPNGSYAYITNPDNLLLDIAALEPEKALVDSLLKAALNEGLNPGANATSFLANADFSDKFNHWEGALMTNTTISRDTTTRAAESWSAAPMDMHQTVKLPQNGVYELTLNGFYSVGNLNEGTQQGAMVYLNDNENYLPAIIEGVISTDDAIDGTNCWIAGDSNSNPDYKVKDNDGNVTGYTPNGLLGSTYAFKGNRYPARILVNVTDKQLTVGVRNPHVITTGNEWTVVGAMTLTYRGTIDEAGTALDSTLLNMKQRADFLLQKYESDEEDYRHYPGYSQELRDSLQTAINAIATTSDNAGKYALIEEIGNLFVSIYNCKANYADMADMAHAIASIMEKMNNAGTISNDQLDEVYNAYDATIAGFNEGTYTSEQAAAGGDIAGLSILPKKNANGAYEIADATGLDIFASLVNGGLNSADAVLTADITTDAFFPMIGTSTYKYNGTFDGQGHTITADIETPDADHVGVFAYLGDGTITNTAFEGTVSGRYNTGVIGDIIGKGTVRNVVSRMNIAGYNNVGGLAGNATSGPQTIENYLFAGSVTATLNGAGGVYGWSSSNTVNANNILSVGEITGEQIAYLFRVKCDGNVGTAGAAGCYVNGSNMYILRTSEPDDYPTHHTLVSGTPLWWGEFLTDVIKEVTVDDLKSGKTCFDLNGGSTDSPAWLETLGEDTIPMLLSQSKVVYFDEDKEYYYNEKPVGIDEVKKGDAAKEGKETSAPMYDLSGQRIFKPLKGTVYIQGGKKKIAK